MFGRAKPITQTSRGKRAHQLRQQRLAATNQKKSNKDNDNGSGCNDNNKNNDGDEEIFVVSGVCTIICGLFIVILGAALATAVFTLQNPECMNGVIWGFFSDTKSFASPEAQQQAAVATNTNGARKMTGLLRRMEALPSDQTKEEDEEEENQAKEDAATTSTFLNANLFPPQCTAEQLSKVRQQLPPGGCVANQKKPWRRMSCSFSMATTCGGSDPIWLRKYHSQRPSSETSNNNNKPFTTIHVGCNKGYDAVDMLSIGSMRSSSSGGGGSTSTHISLDAWMSAFVQGSSETIDEKASLECPRRAVIAAVHGDEPSFSSARAYCLEAIPKKVDHLTATKAKLGMGEELYLNNVALSDTEGTTTLKVYNQDVLGAQGSSVEWAKACSKPDSNCPEVPVETLDHWVSQTAILPGDPIHYLSLGSEGHDSKVLQGGTKLLERVQYLDFQYHWIGEWIKQSLKDLVETRLKGKGFACYFAGGGEDQLWRITDCWQDHYDHKFYANIACVNTQLPESRPLAQEMEAIFQRTLEQSLQFGEV